MQLPAELLDKPIRALVVAIHHELVRVGQTPSVAKIGRLAHLTDRSLHRHHAEAARAGLLEARPVGAWLRMPTPLLCDPSLSPREKILLAFVCDANRNAGPDKAAPLANSFISKTLGWSLRHTIETRNAVCTATEGRPAFLVVISQKPQNAYALSRHFNAVLAGAAGSLPKSHPSPAKIASQAEHATSQASAKIAPLAERASSEAPAKIASPSGEDGGSARTSHEAGSIKEGPHARAAKIALPATSSAEEDAAKIARAELAGVEAPSAKTASERLPKSHGGAAKVASPNLPKSHRQAAKNAPIKERSRRSNSPHSPPTLEALLPPALREGWIRSLSEADPEIRVLLAASPWHARCAAVEELRRRPADNPVHRPQRFMRLLLERHAVQQTRSGFDPPDYDPWVHGPPAEARNAPLWSLREAFPEAPSLEAARRLELEQREVEQRLERARFDADRSMKLSAPERIAAFGYDPVALLHAHGQATPEETALASASILEALRQGRRPDGALHFDSEGATTSVGAKASEAPSDGSTPEDPSGVGDQVTHAYNARMR